MHYIPLVTDRNQLVAYYFDRTRLHTGEERGCEGGKDGILRRVKEGERERERE